MKVIFRNKNLPTYLQLPARYPDIHHFIASLLESAFGSSSIGHHLRLSHQGLLCNLSEESYFSALSLEDLLVDSDKLQQRLTTAVSESKASAFMALSDSDHCSARLRSVAGKEAGAWLHAIPSVNELALDAREFRLAVCLRLGLPLFDNWISSCDCGSTVDRFGYHLLTCKRHGGPVWEHDLIVSAWSSCLNSVSVLHKKEVRNRYVDSFGQARSVTSRNGGG